MTDETKPLPIDKPLSIAQPIDEIKIEKALTDIRAAGVAAELSMLEAEEVMWRLLVEIIFTRHGRNTKLILRHIGGVTMDLMRRIVMSRGMPGGTVLLH